jgi:hypothetical protein
MIFIVFFHKIIALTTWFNTPMAPWRVEGVEAGFHQRANRGESGENVPSFFFLRGPKLDGFNIVKYGLIWFNIWFNIRLNMV